MSSCGVETIADERRIFVKLLVFAGQHKARQWVVDGAMCIERNVRQCQMFFLQKFPPPRDNDEEELTFFVSSPKIKTVRNFRHMHMFTYVYSHTYEHLRMCNMNGEMLY